MTRDAVIFDVDGTLAEFDPIRVHDWVLGVDKQWDPFFEHMASAQVIEPIRRLVLMMKAQAQQILICSGRPRSHQQHTEAWLTRHGIPFDGVYLRCDGDDPLPDEEVKAKALRAMRADGFKPWLVVDDRDDVVKRWRELGLTCLQCAPGNF